jgi:hypothetical protein
VLGRDFADALGDQIRAFCDDDGRLHREVVPFQRDGVMRRVHHHDGGARHGGHHAATSELALTSFERSPRFRIAFGLTQLVFDLLLRHLHALFKVPALVRIIAQSDDDQDDAELPADFVDQIGDRENDLTGHRLPDLREEIHVRSERRPQHRRDGDQLQDLLGEVDDDLFGKHARETGQRIDLRRTRFERFEREHETRLQHVYQNARRQREAEEQQQSRTDERERTCKERPDGMNRKDLAGRCVSQHRPQHAVDRANGSWK